MRGDAAERADMVGAVDREAAAKKIEYGIGALSYFRE